MLTKSHEPPRNCPSRGLTKGALQLLMRIGVLLRGRYKLQLFLPIVVTVNSGMGERFGNMVDTMVE